MAGNLPVANTTEVKIVWGQGGVPAALTILHYIHPVGFIMNQSEIDVMSTGIKSSFTSSGLAAVCWTGMSLMRVEARNMDSNSDPWWVAPGAAVPGTSAANPLPAATSLVVSLKTGLRGRSYNGRVYLWGFTEDANDVAGGASAPAAAAAPAFITAISQFILAGGTLPLAILSRWTTPPGSPPGTAPIERNPPLRTLVTSMTLKDTRWDVQRRRAVPGI